MGGSEQQVAYGLLKFAHQQLGGCICFYIHNNNTISGNGKQNNGVSSSGVTSMDSACPAFLNTHQVLWGLLELDRDKELLPFYTCAGRALKPTYTFSFNNDFDLDFHSNTFINFFVFCCTISLPRPRRDTSKHSDDGRDTKVIIYRISSDEIGFSA